MSLTDDFVGFWKVVDCAPVALNLNTKGIQGTIFQLGKTGDVTWEIPDDAVLTPLFKCDTYEIVLKKSYVSHFILRLGAYKGHVIDCIVKTYKPHLGKICISDGWCLLTCKKFKEISYENSFEQPFSFLPALQDSYFSDITIRACNNKEFKVHSCILKLSAPDIDWFSKPTPLSNLSEDVIFAVLHFLYTQYLPPGLKESTIKSIILSISQISGMDSLISTCHSYIKSLTLKNKIISLISDIHTCVTHIIDCFANNQFNNLTSDPAKLYSAIKNSIREAAVAASKVLVICDIYTKQKNKLSKEEGQEIYQYAKSKISIFINQFKIFLIDIKKAFRNVLPSQRQEMVLYLVPEVENVFDIGLLFLIKINEILKIMLARLEKEEETYSQKALENLEQFTDNVLFRKELSSLRGIIHRMTNVLLNWSQKKENFKLMSAGNKVRLVAKNLEQLIEEFPILVFCIEQFINAVDENLQWNESQFCFKVGIYKVSEVLKKFLLIKESLQDLLTDLCDLIQRDSFSQNLMILSLLKSSLNSVSNNSEVTLKEETIQMPFEQDFLSVLSFDCQNQLSLAAKELLKSGQETDMIFEIITDNESESFIDDAQKISDDSLTKSKAQLEVCKIAAHRVIVASRCDWFRRALLSGMQEDINRKIQVHNTSPFLFSLFLKYLYSGELDCFILSVDHISELLLLSDRYELDSLKQICEYGLKQHLDADSVLYFYSMADRFNAKILKRSCKEYIVEHPEVIDSSLFEELSDNLQSEMYEVLIHGKPQALTFPMDEVSSCNLYDVTDIEEMITNIHFNSNLSTPDANDITVSLDFPRLEAVLDQLREIIGQDISRSQLIQIILAADYDVNRALNFYYSSS